MKLMCGEVFKRVFDMFLLSESIHFERWRREVEGWEYVFDVSLSPGVRRENSELFEAKDLNRFLVCERVWGRLCKYLLNLEVYCYDQWKATVHSSCHRGVSVNCITMLIRKMLEVTWLVSSTVGDPLVWSMKRCLSCPTKLNSPIPSGGADRVPREDG